MADHHPVAVVVALAVAARLVVLVGVAVVAGGSLFEDDGTYVTLAAQRASGATSGWGDYEFFLYRVTGTFLVPLTALFAVVGPSQVLGQAYTASFAVLAAGATTRLALEVVPRRWAVAAGLVVALLPSQVLFSSVVLKDAAVWAVLALLGLTVAVLDRSTGRRLALALGALVVLLLLLGHLRVHTTVVAAWAAAAAAWLAPAPGRLLRGLGVTAATVAVLVVLGAGVAGLALVTTAGGSLEERRLGNAALADTAFVTPASPKTTTVSPKPETGGGAPGGSTPTTAAAVAVIEESGTRNLRALPRGLSVMLLEPYPNQVNGNPRLAFALAENLLWWPLLALAAVGAVTGWARRAALAFPLLSGGAILFLYALSEGNFGTAYRHRGEVVWAAGLLAAAGAHHLWTRYRPQPPAPLPVGEVHPQPPVSATSSS